VARSRLKAHGPASRGMTPTPMAAQRRAVRSLRLRLLEFVFTSDNEAARLLPVCQFSFHFVRCARPGKIAPRASSGFVDSESKRVGSTSRFLWPRSKRHRQMPMAGCKRCCGGGSSRTNDQRPRRLPTCGVAKAEAAVDERRMCDGKDPAAGFNAGGECIAGAPRNRMGIAERDRPGSAAIPPGRGFHSKEVVAGARQVQWPEFQRRGKQAPGLSGKDCTAGRREGPDPSTRSRNGRRERHGSDPVKGAVEDNPTLTSRKQARHRRERARGRGAPARTPSGCQQRAARTRDAGAARVGPAQHARQRGAGGGRARAGRCVAAASDARGVSHHGRKSTGDNAEDHTAERSQGSGRSRTSWQKQERAGKR